MMMPSIFGENLFDDFFDDFGLAKEMRNLDRKLYGRRAGKEMLTDIKEHDDHYDLEIELPGFKKEDLSVSLEDGYLTVTAEKSHDQDKGHQCDQPVYSAFVCRIGLLVHWSVPPRYPVLPVLLLYFRALQYRDY